jgi:hypothetical protein
MEKASGIRIGPSNDKLSRSFKQWEWSMLLWHGNLNKNECRLVIEPVITLRIRTK